MSNRNRAFFGNLVTEAKKAESVEPKGLVGGKRAGNYLLERDNALAGIASGDVVEQTLRWVEPERCRMWLRHNRRYELLNEARCADLIEGFKAQGRQEFPAIVRPVLDDPGYQYEVICGARRHWTVTWLRRHNYPQFRFLVEVRELGDEEAFRLSDIENRDRRDISDYERAVDYKDALGRYYKTQKEMARRLEVSEPWLSQYLDLADLPEEIVEAYPGLEQIRVQHARALKPLLKSASERERVVQKAKELRAMRENGAEGARAMVDGQQLVKLLMAVGAKARPKNAGLIAEFKSPSTGTRILTATRQGRSGLLLRVAPNTGASKGDLLEACRDALDWFIG